jgi:ATP-dependent DNA ligase
VALPTFTRMREHPATHTAAEWAFEPKLDGWRAIVYVDETVMVRTRTGRDITSYVENLQALTDLGRRFVPRRRTRRRLWASR